MSSGCLASITAAVTLSLFGRNIPLSSYPVSALNAQTVTNFRVVGCTFTANGDFINPQCLDHSTLWTTAFNAFIESNTFLNTFSAGTPRISTAIEIHGDGVAADGNAIYGYNAGINMGNESNGNLTSTNLSARGNQIEMVNTGVVVWLKGTGDTIGVVVAENRITLDPDTAASGIDATSEVIGTGNADHLTIEGNVIRCVNYVGLTTSHAPGIWVGRWDTACVQGNQVSGLPGPGILGDAIVNTTSVWRLNGNIIKNSGFTADSTAGNQYQSGIFLAGGGSTMTALDVQFNTITGSMRYGITGGMAANGGLCDPNTVVGATVATYNNLLITAGADNTGSPGAPNNYFTVKRGVVTRIS